MCLKPVARPSPTIRHRIFRAFRARQRSWLRLGLAMLFLPGAMYGWDLATLKLHAQAPEQQPIRGHVLKRWTTADGLPHNMISALVQTRDGYIWIGTANAGVVRFDGVAFTTFDIMSTPGFPSNAVSSLHEDADGTLWIGTFAGLARYKDGVFTHERLGDEPLHNVIGSVSADAEGHLWVAAGAHLARRDGDRWTTIPIGDTRVTCLLPTRDGTVWVGTTDGAMEWRDGIVRTLTVKDGLPSATVRALHQDRDGQLWIGTAGGLARLAPDGAVATVEPAPLSTMPVSQLFEDSDGVLWIGGQERLFARARDGQLSRSRIGRAASGSQVTVFMEDREQHLWFGVKGGAGGLHRLARERVTTLTTEQGLPCDNTGPVTQGADGTIWMATLCDDGKGLVAIRNGRLTVYTEPAYVESLLAEPDGNVWVGTFGGGLFRLDPRPEPGRFVRVPAPTGGKGDGIAVIHRQGDGSLWLGTAHGLLRLRDGHWTRFRVGEGLVSDDVRSIAAGESGALWIGANSGVSHYENDSFTNYTTAQGLPPGPVRALHVDTDGVLWIGTYGGGLARFKDGTFTRFGTHGGVLDSSVHRILEDDAGYFWITGDRGIRRVSRWELDGIADGKATTLSVVRYDEADGMRSAECNGMAQPAGWRMRDGTLRFPTQGGLVRIDPGRAWGDGPLVPRPRIEHATINNVRYESTAIVRAPPGSSDFAFQYTAPAFARPEQIQFRHRLEGYDADWVEAGSRRVAQYTNLSPGSYRFRVSARSSGGTWTEDEAAVAMVLQPFLYQRLPFQIAFAALALIGVAGLVRWRIASLRQRAQWLEATVAERTVEVARQRDEVADARDRLQAAKIDVEHAHHQVLAVLNQLEIGVLVLDAAGTVSYVSASARRLLREEFAVLVGRSWTDCLPLVETDRVQVMARIEAPSPLSGRVPVQMVLSAKRYWMEIDVREEPHPGTGRILYIYNVTEVSALSTRGDRREGPHDLVGRSTAMHVVYKQIRDVARVDATVLIEGETGSGKDLVARAIHRGSRRADKPFVAVNAAGLSESLLASQLFGHRRGAFTGAIADQVGVFEAASGGTLFLDEIGDIPVSVQVSLLRVLQEREITRVGESRARRLDVRFLAATHRDLAQEVAEGRFRQDLLYRIRVATIRVPPLRDRIDDVPLLVDAFITQAARQSGRAIPEVSREAMAALMGYSWPGNVRQLKSAIEQALLSSTGRVLRVEELPGEVVDGVNGADDVIAAALPGASERERLMEALRRSGGNRSEAARLLGIGRATLYRRLAVHDIDADTV